MVQGALLGNCKVPVYSRDLCLLLAVCVHLVISTSSWT